MLPASPISMLITEAGFHEVLPASTIEHTSRHCLIMQITTKKASTINLLEGAIIRWSGDIPKNSVVSIDFRPLSWDLHGEPLIIHTPTPNPQIHINVLAHAAVRV